MIEHPNQIAARALTAAKRRGRPAKLGEREGSGRLSRAKTHIRRAETEAETVTTAVEARMRLYGLTAAQARQDMAGTVIGRLVLGSAPVTILVGKRGDTMERAFGRRHLGAARTYAAIKNRHSAALMSEGAVHQPPLDGGGLGTPEDYENFCAEAVSRHDEIMGALNAMPFANLAIKALDNVVVRNIEFPVLYPFLYQALEVIHKIKCDERDGVVDDD